MKNENNVIFVTINHLDKFQGAESFRVEDELILRKDKDNEYDDEAIAVYDKHDTKSGYVANSVHSVVRGTYSAGRIYDLIKDGIRCRIRFILSEEDMAIGVINSTEND